MPENYEPEFFQPSNIPLTFRNLPLVVNIGQIKTPELDMKLKYSGLDPLFKMDITNDASTGNLLQAVNHRAETIETNKDDETQLPGQLNNISLITDPATSKGLNQNIEELQNIRGEIKKLLEAKTSINAKTCSECLKIDQRKVNDALESMVKDGDAFARTHGRYKRYFKEKPTKSSEKESECQPEKASFDDVQNASNTMKRQDMAQNSVEERTLAAKLGKTTESNSNGIIKILTHDDASAAMFLSQCSDVTLDKKTRKYSVIKDPIETMEPPTKRRRR